MSMSVKFKRAAWYISLFFLTLSGFAQMPIFKRYYVADIPGLGWLAQFYVTHIIHYFFAAVFIAYITFAVFDYFLSREKGLSGPAAYLKWAAFIGLLVTGVLMVIKNFQGTPFSHAAIIGLDILHLGSCMLMIAALIYGAVKKKKA